MVNSDSEMSTTSDDGIESDDCDESVLDYLEDEIDESEENHSSEEELCEESELDNESVVSDVRCYKEDKKDEIDSDTSMLTEPEDNEIGQSEMVNSVKDESSKTIQTTRRVDGEGGSGPTDIIHRVKRLKRESE